MDKIVRGLWHRTARHLVAATAAAIGAVALLAGCGSHAATTTGATATRSPTTTSPTTTSPTVPGHGTHPLTVTPPSAPPASAVTFGFRSLRASGRRGQVAVSYVLSVSTPRPGASSHCVGAHTMALGPLTAGQPVDVTVGPAQLGGRWCTGSYTARVDEFARPSCGPGEVCPQLVRVLAVIGPARFRIAG